MGHLIAAGLYAKSNHISLQWGIWECDYRWGVPTMMQLQPPPQRSVGAAVVALYGEFLKISWLNVRQRCLRAGAWGCGSR